MGKWHLSTLGALAMPVEIRTFRGPGRVCSVLGPLASFLNPLFPDPPEVEKCRCTEPPEVPTNTADLTSGIPGRPRRDPDSDGPGAEAGPLSSATPA